MLALALTIIMTCLLSIGIVISVIKFFVDIEKYKCSAELLGGMIGTVIGLGIYTFFLISIWYLYNSATIPV